MQGCWSRFLAVFLSLQLADPGRFWAAAAVPPGLTIHWEAGVPVRLSWGVSAFDLTLEQTTSLTPPVEWEPVSAIATLEGGRWQVDVPLGDHTLFFRLAGPALPPPTSVVETSPRNGETGVSVSRETILRLSGALAPSASIDSTRLYAEFGGRRILSRAQLSSDRRTLSLFYLEPLPGNARIRVTLRGDGVLDDNTASLDADGDGEPGGTGALEFDTVGITGIPGTAVIGRVFASQRNPDGSNRPLKGVTITVDGAEQTLRTTTDAQGNFRLEPAPAGRFFVSVDGHTANESHWPDGAYYPFVGKAWVAIAGKTDNLAGGSGEVFLPLIPAGTLQTVSPTEDTVIGFPPAVIAANPALQGVAVTVPANSLYSNNGTRGGSVGIAPVPPDRLPERLPAGLNFPLVITIQTDGPSNFDVPAPVRFPNLPDPVTGELLPPGAKTSLWSFNHDTGVWEIQGSMTISADGKYAVSDPGVGIRQPGWHATSPSVPGNPGGPSGPSASSSSSPVPGGPACVSASSSGPVSPLSTLPHWVAMNTPDPNDPCLIDPSLCPTLTTGPIFLGPGLPVASQPALVTCAPASGPATNAPTPPTQSQPPRNPAPRSGGPSFDITGATNVLFYADGQEIRVRYRNTSSGANAPDLLFEFTVEGPGREFLTGGTDFSHLRAPGETGVWGPRTRDFVPRMNPQNAAPPDLIERDQLYMAKITIRVRNAVDQSVVGSRVMYIGRFVDASDGNPNDGILDFPKTYFGNGFSRFRKVDFFHAGLPTFVFYKPVLEDPDATFHLTQIDPVDVIDIEFHPYHEARGATEIVQITGPAAGAICGTLTLRGDADATHFFLDETKFGLAIDEYNRTHSESRHFPSLLGAIRGELRSIFDSVLPGWTGVISENPSPVGADIIIDEFFAPMMNPNNGLNIAMPVLRDGNARRYFKDFDFRLDPAYGTDPLSAKETRNDAQFAFIMSQALNRRFVGAGARGEEFVEVALSEALSRKSNDLEAGRLIAREIARCIGHHLGLVELGVFGIAPDQDVYYVDPNDIPSRGPVYLDCARAGGRPVMCYDESGPNICEGFAWRTALGMGGRTDVERTYLLFLNYSYMEGTADAIPGVRRTAPLNPNFFRGTVHPILSNPAVPAPQAVGDPSPLGVTGEAGPASLLGVMDTGLAQVITQKDFGSVAVDGPNGQSGAARLRLLNLGRQALTLRQVRLVSASGFGLGPEIPPGFVLEPGAGREFTVTFDPVVAGPHQASLVFETDANPGTTVVRLRGEGVRAAGRIRVAVNQNNAGGASLSGSGVAIAGFARISNVGPAPLAMSTLHIREGQTHFAVGGFPVGGANLAPGQGLDLDLTFTPKAQGLLTGVVEVESSDPDSPLTEFTVVGTGVPGAGVQPQWGDDFVLITTADGASRSRSDSEGRFFAYVPPGQPYTVEIYDPASGLVSFGTDVGQSDPASAQFPSPLFRASTEDDRDFNGLPDDVDRILGPGNLLDFTTSTSPSTPGYDRVTNAPYDRRRGFGWTEGIVAAGFLDNNAPLAAGFAETADGTFGVDVAEGIYEITVQLAPTSGDAEIYCEGELVGVLASPGLTGVSAHTVRVAVRDGQATLRFLSKNAAPVRVAALRVVPVQIGTIAPPGRPLEGSFVTLLERLGNDSQVRREQVLGPGGTFQPEMLWPNTAYRFWALHKATRQVAVAEFTALGPGTPVSMPVLAFGPSNAPDSDGDGLDDIVELILGTSATKADTDGDGASDGVELELERDPLIPDTLPARILASASTFGPAMDVSASDGLVAVAGTGSGVSLFNTFGNMPPLLVAQLPTDPAGTSSRVAASGRWVIFADGPLGAGILDAQSTDPAHVTRLSTQGSVSAVAADGSLALVGTQQGDVLLVSLPLGTVLRQLSLGVEVRDLLLRGNAGYVLTPTGLRTLRADPQGLVGTGAIETPLGGDVEYHRMSLGAGQVLATFDSQSQDRSGFSVWVVADPAQPTLGTTQVLGDCCWRMVVPDGASRLLSNRSIADPGEFSVYDFSNPAQLGNELSKVPVEGGVYALTLRDGLAFLAVGSYEAGLQLMQFTEAGVGGSAPTVTLATSLGNAGAVEGERFEVRATCVDDVLTRAVEFYVNGALVATDRSFPFEVTIAAPRLAGQPAFAVEARAYDTAGHRGTATVSIPLTHDAAPPQVLFSVPGPGAQVHGTRTVGLFLGEPLDPASLTRKTLLLLEAGADGTFGTPDDVTVPNGTISQDTTAGAVYLTFPSELPAGNYRLVLASGARDTAGNALSSTFTSEWRIRQGLQGEYFADENFLERRVVRSDAAIDFTWSGAPAAGLPTNNFSIRWQGRLVAKVTGDVRLRDAYRGGTTRVWLDGNLVTEDFFNGWSGRTFPMVAGTSYPLVIEHVNSGNGFGNGIRLTWTDNPYDDRIYSVISPDYLLAPLDQTPPVLLGVEADPSFERVRIRFSEPLDPASATNRANYSLGAGVQILAATLSETLREVSLTTSRLADGTQYTLHVSGVRDGSEQRNAVIAGTAMSFHSLVTGSGFVRREFLVADDSAGAGSSAGAQSLPGTPFDVVLARSMESVIPLSGVSPVYLHRMRGYVVPPVSGDYRFFLNADAPGWLYLSTGEDPEQAREIAIEPEGLSAARAWTTAGAFGRDSQNPQNRSALISLTAGRRYYIEAFAYGVAQPGNNLGVAWQIPGTPALKNGDPGIGSQHLATFTAPDSRGFFIQESFPGIAGTNVVDVTTHPAFPASPARLQFQSLLRRDDIADAEDGGIRWTGYLTPPVSGVARFWLDADMPGSFRLSTDADPAHLRDVVADGRAYNGGGQGDWHQFFRVEKNDGPAPRGSATVVAGQPHYFELVLKSAKAGTPGFNERLRMGLNWTLPGQLDPVSSPSAIPSAYVSTRPGAEPLGFARVPVGQTIVEESPVTFVAIPSGAPPFQFQWFSNNVAIVGATNAVYSLPLVPFEWSGATYKVAVTNLVGSVVSSPAPLTVVRDQTPPKLNTARGAASLQRASLTFDEPLDASSVTNPQNYSVSGGLQVLAARLLADHQTVELVTSRQTPGSPYTVTVSQVTDDAPLRNPVAPGSHIGFTAFSQAPYFLNREVFASISGATVATLTSSPRYPHQPDLEGFVAAFEGPANVANGYGSRLFGLLVPPETGTYTFYLAADDQAELWLSNSESPSGKQRIAWEPTSAAQARDWTGTANRPNGENISAPVNLTAGNRYYVEVLHKENALTDFVGVAWKLPSQSTAPAKGSPPISSSYLIGFADPVGASIEITQDLPEDTTPHYSTGNGAILQVSATSTRTPIVYQWQRNGVDIPGANTPTYFTPPLTPDDNGAKYRCRIAIPGAVVFSLEKTFSVF